MVPAKPNFTVYIILFTTHRLLGMLIVGLVLCFLSAVKIGLLALGYFLVFYYKSIDDIAFRKRIPFLHNLLAGTVGILSLLLGLILSFTTSVRYGLFSVVGVLLGSLIVKCLMLIELKFLKRKFGL